MQRQLDMLDKKHEDFITFVIKDQLAEIDTEALVTFEFMDRSALYSITSVSHVS